MNRSKTEEESSGTVPYSDGEVARGAVQGSVTRAQYMIASARDRALGRARPGTGENAAFWRPALADALGVPIDDVEINASAGEPPELRVAGRRVHLSFSSAVGWRACAWSEAGPIGIDVEAPESVADLLRGAEGPAMLDLAGACEVFDRFAAEAQWEGAAKFAALWTAKEAVLKARGVGLEIDPRRVRFVDTPCHGAEHGMQVGRCIPALAAVIDTVSSGSEQTGSEQAGRVRDQGPERSAIWAVAWVSGPVGAAPIVAIAHRQ